MRRLSWALGWPLIGFLASAGLEAQLVTLGGEFQVNSYTTNKQDRPAVATDSDGDFVVVWRSVGSGGTDSSGYSVQGQRFNSDGSPLGGEFQVNTYTYSSQYGASVATDSAGDFVVVWQSSGSGGTDSAMQSVQGQRFASDGSALGGEFQVNTYTTGRQKFAALAVEASVGFVVVWTSYGSGGTDSSSYSVQGQRYTSGGSPLGGEFQVNSYTSSLQWLPAVAANSAGDFVVVWQSSGSGGTDNSAESIQGRRFSSDGSPLGGEFQVNSYTPNGQKDPAVATDSDGDFVVVWQSTGSGGTDSSSYSIQGRRFASDGSPLGGDFQINTHTSSYQYRPSVAVDSGDEFVVVWSSDGSGGTDSSKQSVQGQRFASDGSPIGGEFQVNTFTASQQRFPAVAPDAGGAFLVVWSSDGSGGTDSDDSSVQGQRYGLSSRTLTVDKDGTGTGAASSSPAGIDCGSTCSAPFDEGSLVTLTPNPDAGCNFVAWSGDCDPSGQVTMEIDRDCTATFDLDIYNFSVTKVGSGSGTVTSDPEGIDCGEDCDEPFSYGTPVTLTQVADPGSLFISWTGDPDCTDGQVAVDEAMTCIANFYDESHVIFTDGFESGDTSAW